MIDLGDRKNRGYVDLHDFMWLMRKIGLIKQEKPETDVDKEYN